MHHKSQMRRKNMGKILIPHLWPERQFIEIPFQPAKVADETITAIRGYAKNTNFTGPAIIGLSGGIDSALIVALTRLALGRDRVKVFKMPYGKLGTEAIRYADLVIQAFRIPAESVYTINIKPAVDAAAKQLDWHKDEPNANILLGNLMARERMQVLATYAGRLTGRMFGTENLTEHLLAYFTSWGDAASHVESIRRLYKTQVFQLAAYLDVPQEVIERKPTADLWADQTDEGELGVPYQFIDQVLYATVDLRLSPGQLVAMGIPANVVEAVLNRMYNYDFKNHFPTIL